jgi:hypothetical protein
MDCDQWDNRKKSLFIESLLNNLTIPAFFFCEDNKGDAEVIDGQLGFAVLHPTYAFLILIKQYCVHFSC